MSIIPGIENRRARADRDEQWILGIAEALAGLLLESHDMVGELLFEALRKGSSRPHVLDTGLGRDDEAGRNRNPEGSHLGKAEPLPAEQLAAAVRSVRVVVDVLRHGVGTLLVPRAPFAPQAGTFPEAYRSDLHSW